MSPLISRVTYHHYSAIRLLITIKCVEKALFKLCALSNKVFNFVMCSKPYSDDERALRIEVDDRESSD